MTAGPQLRDETLALLRGLDLLAGIDEALLAGMAEQTEVVRLAGGELLFRAGDEAASAYVVASGRLSVERTDGTVIRVLRRGAAIGELALLSGGVRSASVRASRDSTLITISRTQFEALLRGSPAFSLALTRVIAERLAATAAPPSRAQLGGTLAVVGLDGGNAAREAAELIAEEMRRCGSGAELVMRLDGQPHEWPARLARIEAANDRVVMIAGEYHDPWSAFCLREADLVVAVTHGAPDQGWLSDGVLGDCELVVIGRRPRRELDVLRPRLVRAIGTTDGLPRLMGQLARRVTGKAVGVILSGGGARAFAHIGVIEELQRSGVAIDRVAGVSLGAVVAAFFAGGGSPEEAFARCHHYFVERSPTNDYTLPLVSVIRGRKTARMLEDQFGDARIEELELPFFCASADLMRRELVVHRSGHLAGALLAGLSIPGIFPPVLDDLGRLLVDGGVIDNLPVRAMADPYEGPVIAVDVTSDAIPPRAPRRTGLPLRRALTGSRAALPRLPETIIRCMTLASADTEAARRRADLVIAPRVAGIGILDWHRLAEMRAAGIEATRHALDHGGELAALLAGEEDISAPAARAVVAA